MLEPYVRPGIDDRPDLDKVLSPEDKAAVARLAIKNRRRPPEASADQPEAQAVRLLPPVLRQPLLQPPVWTLPRRICRPPTSTCAIPWSPSMANALPQVRSPDSTGVSSLLQFWSAHLGWR